MDYWTCSVCYLIYYIPDEECVVWNIGHSAFAISYIYAIHLTKGVLYGILDTQCLLSYTIHLTNVVWNIGHAVFAILYTIHLTTRVLYEILQTRCLLSYILYT